MELETDDQYYWISGKTYQFRLQMRAAGGEWDRERQAWRFDRNLAGHEQVTELYERCNRSVQEAKREASEKSVRTRREKGLAKKHADLINAKIARLNEMNENSGRVAWIPETGYCVYCKTNVIYSLDLDTIDYIIACPKCNRAWDN